MSAAAAELRRQYGALSADLNGKMAVRERLKQEVTSAEKRIKELAEQSDIYREAGQHLTVVAENAQGVVREHFEQMVTHALQGTVGEQFSFGIDWAKAGVNSAVDFKIIEAVQTDDGTRQDECDPRRGGGGIRDLLAFALRLAYLELTNNSGPIVLDEPFSQVSPGFTENAARLLREVQKALDLQLIIITHNPGLIECADKVIRVTKGGDGISKIQEER
jgi:DNA repair exonuclease SbcCD ATPase subunit